MGQQQRPFVANPSEWEVIDNQDLEVVPDQETTEAPQGSALGRFGSNAWEVLNPLNIVSGVYQAARHPIDTGTAIIGQQANQFRQAGQAFNEGRYSEMVGHGAAGLLPVVGPMAAETGEQIASGDYAGGAGKAFGMLVPFGAAEGVARLGVKAAPAAAADVFERGAASRYADVMSPKSSAAKGQRMAAKAEKIAPEIAKDTSNAAWSRAGLQENLQGKLESAKALLDDADDARNAGKPIDTRPIVQALKEKRAKLTAQPFEATRTTPEYRGRGARTAYPETEIQVKGQAPVTAEQMTPHQRGYRTLDEDGGRFAKEPERAGVPLGKSTVPQPNRAQVAVIDQAIREIEALGPIAPYDALRTIRRAYDGPAEVKYNPAVTPDFLANQSKATGSADVAGTIRDTLAREDPITAAANAEYSLYKNAVEITKAAQELEKARPRTGRQIMAKLTGSLIGGAEGGTAGAVTGYAAGPLIEQLASAGFTTKLQSAKLMQDLATAIRTGNVERATTLSFKLRQLAKQAEIVRAKGQAGQAPTPQPAQ